MEKKNGLKAFGWGHGSWATFGRLACTVGLMDGRPFPSWERRNGRFMQASKDSLLLYPQTYTIQDGDETIAMVAESCTVIVQYL